MSSRSPTVKMLISSWCELESTSFAVEMSVGTTLAASLRMPIGGAGGCPLRGAEGCPVGQVLYWGSQPVLPDFASKEKQTFRRSFSKFRRSDTAPSCSADASPSAHKRSQGVRTRPPEDRSRAVVGASDTRVHSVRKCADQAGIASLLLCRSLRPFAQPGLRVVRLFLLRDGPENRGRSSHP